MRLSELLKSGLLYGFLAKEELLSVSRNKNPNYKIISKNDHLGYIVLESKMQPGSQRIIGCIQRYFTTDEKGKKKRNIPIENALSCAKVKRNYNVSDLIAYHDVENECLQCHLNAIRLVEKGILFPVKNKK